MTTDDVDGVPDRHPLGYAIQALAIIGVVIVAIVDLMRDATISPVVYGGLCAIGAGPTVGHEISKVVPWGGSRQ